MMKNYKFNEFLARIFKKIREKDNFLKSYLLLRD